MGDNKIEDILRILFHIFLEFRACDGHAATSTQAGENWLDRLRRFVYGVSVMMNEDRIVVINGAGKWETRVPPFGGTE